MSVDMLSLIDKMFKPKEKGGKDRFFLSFNSRKQKTDQKNKKTTTIIYIYMVLITAEHDLKQK